MTNQNDTQDEAERLWNEFKIAEGLDRHIVSNFSIRDMQSAMKYGYRAGVASKEAEILALTDDNKRMVSTLLNDGKFHEDDEMIKALREENSRLKESLSAITVIQQRDAAIKELAASRAEVERLKEQIDPGIDGQRMRFAKKVSELEEQLAAEKSRSKKLVEATKLAVKFMDSHKYLDFDESESQMIDSLERVLDDYRTDSGDGD